jgi:hypothetical protein
VEPARSATAPGRRTCPSRSTGINLHSEPAMQHAGRKSMHLCQRLSRQCHRLLREHHEYVSRVTERSTSLTLAWSLGELKLPPSKSFSILPYRVSVALERGSGALTTIDGCWRKEGGADPNAQYVEKLNRLTAESWRKRALEDFGSFQKRRPPRRVGLVVSQDHLPDFGPIRRYPTACTSSGATDL